MIWQCLGAAHPICTQTHLVPIKPPLQSQCNTPKKPNNLKVENSIMKQQEIFYEKIKIHRHTDRQHT